MKFSPKNCRCVITGASSGIGRSLALEFADASGRVVLLARNEQKLEKVAEEVRQRGGEAITIVGNVTDASVREAALQAAQQAWGGLDLLVNNAGTSAYGRFIDVSPERLEQIMAVNLFAPAEFIREAAPLLKASPQGTVVNIGSILGQRGLPFASEYCASKFALHGLSESIRPELKKAGIHLLLVAPGTTQTDFKQNVLETHTDPPWKRSGGVSPDYVAQRTLRALKRGATWIVPNQAGGWLLFVNRLCPSIVDRVMDRYG